MGDEMSKSKKDKRNWILISRIHISGRTRNNSWKSLKKYLGLRKLTPIEPTKTVTLTTKTKGELNRKLEQYNKKNHTDFFV